MCNPRQLLPGDGPPRLGENDSRVQAFIAERKERKHTAPKSVIIESDEAFNRFTIATLDFEKASNFAQEAKNHLANSVAYEALLFAAIVSYYRPFSPNEKSDKGSATSSVDRRLLQTLTRGEEKLHEECKRLRNKGLAHSEYALNATRINTSRRVVMSKPFSLVSQGIVVDELLSLIEKVRKECERARASYMLSQNR